MTVNTEASPKRFGVYHRRNSREKWALIVHTGDERAAFRLMLDIAAEMKNKTKGKGSDWAVRKLDNPPTSASPVPPAPRHHAGRPAHRRGPHDDRDD